MRGKLTEDIQNVAYKHFGHNIMQTDLRLMPYIQYCIMNQQRLDPLKINKAERECLSDWRAEGHILGGAGEPIRCTKQFWDAMSEILWLGYARELLEDLECDDFIQDMRRE